jgi:hypothetical protein
MLIQRSVIDWFGVTESALGGRIGQNNGQNG